jgi:hypothetical protein
MRELTDIELDVVGGGDLLAVPVWVNTVTKFINSFPINTQAVAQQSSGWQGFGNFNFQPVTNAINNSV